MLMLLRHLQPPLVSSRRYFITGLLDYFRPGRLSAKDTLRIANSIYYSCKEVCYPVYEPFS